MNPEPILLDVAEAIKYRTISSTHRWYCIYFNNRICCVPSHVNVPPETILCEFTENDVQLGFDIKIWTELSKRIVEIYKELHV